jgi:mannose-6-phosphate isomerase-like protein (cupin superfamily)
MKQFVSEQDADAVLRCSDFAHALSFYTDDLNFRLDGIFPADSPRVAMLTGHGLTIRLQAETTGQRDHEPAVSASMTVNKLADNQTWGTGRAGMQYRDLIPGRLDGAMIASHIRIPDGGPVPDYVHYHHVRLQVIYCYKGWVRVVYEDQGEPFVMHAGDCVLQAPGIRHRVLECSDAFEVVEIGSPAEHETFVDHELELPTATINTQRDFGGQRFVFHQAAAASWQQWQADGFEYRDTGIEDGSRGIGSVTVVRPTASTQAADLVGQAGIQFLFVLQGSSSVMCGDKTESLMANDAVVISGETPYQLSGCSDDLEFLLVTMTT